MLVTPPTTPVRMSPRPPPCELVSVADTDVSEGAGLSVTDVDESVAVGSDAEEESPPAGGLPAGGSPAGGVGGSLSPGRPRPSTRKREDSAKKKTRASPTTHREGLQCRLDLVSAGIRSSLSKNGAHVSLKLKSGRHVQKIIERRQASKGGGNKEKSA